MSDAIEVTWATCHSSLSRCICSRGPRHVGPCVCECGGSWERTEPGMVTIHAWPTPKPSGNPLVDLSYILMLDGAPELPWTAPDEGPQFMPSGLWLTDPLMAALIDAPPLRVQRGGINFIKPPDFRS